MRGRSVRRARLAAAVLVAAFAGSSCALVDHPGDRLLAERDLAGARDLYLETLERRDVGRRVERALFNLGLIYLQPDQDLYDPRAAREVLTRLTYLRPRSEYAARASMVLALQLEATRLRSAIQDQFLHNRQAEERLATLREEASATEARSEDQTKKVGQLGNRLAALQAQIVKLREELAATGLELTEREREIERLKRIDLEEPP